MTATKSSTAATTAVATAPKDIPRGRPVSGRPWKTVQKTRFSGAKYTGTAKLSTTWEQKLVKKAHAKELKALQDEIKARRQGERDAKRQAREDKEKRRKENELKSAAVQVVRCCCFAMVLVWKAVGLIAARGVRLVQISRTHRIKGMSKKQLRNIKKTIVNKHGVVEYVPIYSK